MADVNAGTDLTQQVILANQPQVDVNDMKDVIIAYPRENTLMPTSQLSKYATGVAVEVGYFKEDGAGKYVLDATKGFKTYYHYIHHRNDPAESENVNQYSALDLTATCGNTPAMNYGIVRNNLYRIAVAPKAEDGIKILIKVKKWDKYEHEEIEI
jgi:hypothetical protein